MLATYSLLSLVVPPIHWALCLADSTRSSSLCSGSKALVMPPVANLCVFPFCAACISASLPTSGRPENVEVLVVIQVNQLVHRATDAGLLFVLFLQTHRRLFLVPPVCRIVSQNLFVISRTKKRTRCALQHVSAAGCAALQEGRTRSHPFHCHRRHRRGQRLPAGSLGAHGNVIANLFQTTFQGRFFGGACR